MYIPLIPKNILFTPVDKPTISLQSYTPYFIINDLRSRGGSGSSRWSRNLRIDIRAEQCLAKERQDAAFGLLTLGRADVDEAVDASGGLRSFTCVSRHME
jgi:hypothetical protein